MSNKKLSTISVGIPAYNEEKNIKNLIERLLDQHLDGVKLAKIIVVSDCSIDNTIKEARKVKDFRIVIGENTKRVGLNKVQNKILRMAEEDVLVLLDADVITANNNFLNELVKPILKDKRIGLVGADVSTLKAKTFFEKVIVQSHEFKMKMYTKINEKDNLYLCHGRGRAFSKPFYESLKFPSNVPEDSYSYLECKRRGFRFNFAPHAKVLFKSPKDFKDHMKQSFRFKDSPEKLKNYFPANFVAENYSIPLRILIAQLFIASLRKPILMSAYVFINMYTIWKKRDISIDHVVFDPSISTKNLELNI